MSRDSNHHSLGSWRISQTVIVRDISTSKVLAVQRLTNEARVRPTRVQKTTNAPFRWLCWSSDEEGTSSKMFSMQDPQTEENFFIEVDQRRLKLRRGDDPSVSHVSYNDPRIFIHSQNRGTSTMVLRSAKTFYYVNLNRESSRVILDEVPSGDINWSLEFE